MTETMAGQAMRACLKPLYQRAYQGLHSGPLSDSLADIDTMAHIMQNIQPKVTKFHYQTPLCCMPMHPGTNRLRGWVIQLGSRCQQADDQRLGLLLTAHGHILRQRLHTWARSIFPSQNVQNTLASDHFWKLRCRKRARRCDAKHIWK